MPSNNYLDKMEKYRYMPPLNHLPDVEKPQNAVDYIVGTLRMPSNFVNVRGGPGVTYRTLSQLYAITAKNVKLYPDSKKNGWVFIEQGETAGWVSLQGDKVFLEENEPEETIYDVEVQITIPMKLTKAQMETFDPTKVTIKVMKK